jgi:hypothetical protein
LSAVNFIPVKDPETVEIENPQSLLKGILGEEGGMVNLGDLRDLLEIDHQLD